MAAPMLDSLFDQTLGHNLTTTSFPAMAAPLFLNNQNVC